MQQQKSMKLGVFTVSMPDYEPFEAMEKLASLGYEGVEWRVTEDKGDKSNPSFWSGNRSSMTAQEIIDRAATLKEKAKALGLAMPSLAAYIDSLDLKAVELNFKAAAALGAKNVRISAGSFHPEKDHFPKLFEAAKKQYRKVIALAKKYKVRAVLETHMGLLAPSVVQAMRIIDGCDPKHVGIMWDPGNQVVEGGEVYAMALQQAGKYLAEVHIKNMVYESREVVDGQQTWKTRACSIQKGIVNWPRVIAELKKIRYSGWLFFEDFSTEVPLNDRLAQNLAYFKSLIG